MTALIVRAKRQGPELPIFLFGAVLAIVSICVLGIVALI